MSAAAAARTRLLPLGLLVSAQFVVMADISLVNVALPSIQADLGLDATAATWIVNACVLAFGGLLMPAGRLGDLWGRRPMLRAGAAVFTVGTLVSAGATAAPLLMAGRVIQGAGAAGLSTAAMALVVLGFPGPRRARAMSAWGAASTLGGMTGVVVGGVLVDSLGWRAVFLVTVPVTLLVAALAGRVLPTSPRDPRRRVDGWGATLLTGAIVLLVHGALSGARGGGDDASVALSVVAAAALVAGFVAVERRAEDPLVPLEMLGARVLGTGLVLALLGGAVRASTFVLLALLLQQGLAMAPASAGLAMAPTSATGLVVSLTLLPRLLRAHGPERTLVAGLAVLAAGHLWLAWAPWGAGYVAAVLPGLLLVATGVALSFTPTTMVVAAATPEARVGLAAGMAGAATQVGAALGTAGFIAVGVAAGGAGASIAPPGFPVAFTAAAIVTLVAAAIGSRLRAAPRHVVRA